MAQQAQLTAGEEEVLLPEKLNNMRQVRSVQDVNVLVNAFSLNTSQARDWVYQFDIRFTGVKTVRRGKEDVDQIVLDLNTGPKNDEAKETRRRLCWSLFGQLLDANEDFFGSNKRMFVYDGSQLLFSAVNLGMENNSDPRQFDVDVKRDLLEERCRYYLKNIKSVEAHLFVVDRFELKNAARAFVEGDRRVVHFLELLSSQLMFQQGKHFIFGNRMYEVESEVPLQGDTRVLKAGQQKNVRYVGESDQNAQPILQIDPKKSAFFPKAELVDFLRDYLGVRHSEEFMRGLDKAKKQAKGLSVMTTHLADNQIIFVVAGLTDRGANEIVFEKDGRQVSVAQYFENTYSKRLRHPRLPCAIQRMGRKESYFPLEVLVILPGQRVPIEKQTPKLTEQMIRQCQIKPFELGPQIKQQLDKTMVNSENPYFQEFGVKVDKNLVKAEASVLFPPAIQFSRDRIEPDNRGVLDWKMLGREAQSRHYTLPGEWPKPWVVVIVQQAVSRNDCREFCDRMMRTAEQRGLTRVCQPERLDYFEETNLEYVRGKLEFYADNKCKFLLLFAPGKRNAHVGDIHHVMKYAEQQLNVVTQQVSPEVVRKGSSKGGGAAMVLENICFKLNLKLGGANYELAAAQAFQRANQKHQGLLAELFGKKCKRMFMGLDLSHASPQNLYERQKGQMPAIPTIVGLSYTIGHHLLRMRGTYWAQQARQATVMATRPLINAVKEALKNYSNEAGHFPDHLILFRGGASEGEFKKVKFYEAKAIQEAFVELQGETNAWPKGRPALTMVVCQRQSNYRIFPQQIDPRARPQQQNVQPGTVVDRGVMNAALTEFLLVPHVALQGTAQPVRCTVVEDTMEPRMTLEELENMTNWLSYAHGICCMPTAVPGILYAAGELAKRGRNNWKMHTTIETNVHHFEIPQPNGDSGAMEAELRQLNEDRDTYFDKVSRSIKPGIPTKFWA